MKREIEVENSKYLVSRQLSAFMSRTGKQDIIISKAGSWGARHSDNKLYRACKILDSKSLEVVRDYENLPSIFSNENLLLWGFLTNQEPQP